MASSVESSHVTSESLLGGGRNTPVVPDVPGMMASRIGDLYAEEERRRRVARTERMIRKAESLK